MGINFLFLALDRSGAIFSMASMCIGTFDAMGVILYAIAGLVRLPEDLAVAILGPS